MNIGWYVTESISFAFKFGFVLFIGIEVGRYVERLGSWKAVRHELFD
ncbi:hypothetical protein LAC03_24090 [Levilactobacillus acidifarinae]|nr:hypothetical protein LAC03_24090 [Levilactobacillus acidifarinae]